MTSSAPAQPALPAPAETRSFETPSGPIVARVDGDVVRALGIPYARAGRFERPGPVHAERDAHGQPIPYLAFERAPASPQLSSRVLDALMEGAGEGMRDSEDCQALSITLPADLAPGERVPVMVWIHGGAYVTGAGDLNVYDPRALVTEQRVIVVNVTYRLGVFGYFGDGETIPANLGLLDQLAAVRWVHDNIESFGGAADSITLFGQSAGGDAIAHLMISEGAAGLFQRAIIQSAPLGISAKRSRMVAAMSAAVGDPPRGASTAQILALQGVAERAARRFGLRGGMAFGTQYGHAPLPTEAERSDAWRRVAPRIDVMIGATTEETALYVPFIPPLRWLSALPGVGRLIRRMLVGSTTYATYTRDSRAFARRHRAAGGRAVTYELRWEPEGSPLGAAHVTDLPLLLGSRESWGTTSLVGTTDWAEIARRGRGIRQIWADFARSGTVPMDAAAGLADTITIQR